MDVSNESNDVGRTDLLQEAINSHENKSGLIQVVLYTASKPIKLESPGCLGFKAQ